MINFDLLPSTSALLTFYKQNPFSRSGPLLTPEGGVCVYFASHNEEYNSCPHKELLSNIHGQVCLLKSTLKISSETSGGGFLNFLSLIKWLNIGREAKESEFVGPIINVREFHLTVNSTKMSRSQKKNKRKNCGVSLSSSVARVEEFKFILLFTLV